MLRVERRVSDAEGERGSGRVGVSCTPLRRGKREPFGPLDRVRAWPQSGVTVDTPIGLLRLAETRRIPIYMAGGGPGQFVFCGWICLLHTRRDRAIDVFFGGERGVDGRRRRTFDIYVTP